MLLLLHGVAAVVADVGVVCICCCTATCCLWLHTCSFVCYVCVDTQVLLVHTQLYGTIVCLFVVLCVDAHMLSSGTCCHTHGHMQHSMFTCWCWCYILVVTCGMFAIHIVRGVCTCVGCVGTAVGHV